ncbi:MAG: TetR family transcriptional regulator [Candidatus Lokiarchaeota archaeon]|nr:TetR family transcriptional regulator [Candidatus Lokiarchaeota archaeon]MBD3341099.1 TetR family transcriptional regulator [Candidatus Lokiarchaeota archaeon]
MNPSSTKRNLIIESALKLFSIKGINGTTVSELIEKANVSRRTFYKYFNSKEDLLSEFKRFKQIAYFDKFFREVVPNFVNLSPRAQMEVFIEILFDTFTRPNPYENLFLRALMSPHLLNLFDIDPMDFYNSSIEFIEGLFKRLEIDNPRRKSRLFLTLLDGALLDKHVCDIHDIGIDFKMWMHDVRIEVKDWIENYLLKYRKSNENNKK